MCAQMMAGMGQAYSGGSPGLPLLLPGVLLGFALLAVVIWLTVHQWHGKTILGMRHEPQPHDEPYLTAGASALEVLDDVRGRSETI